MKALKKRRDRVKAKGPFDYVVKQVGAKTAHVTVWLDQSIAAKAAGLSLAIVSRVEQDVASLAAIFPGVVVPQVNLIVADFTGSNDGTGGAYHYGCTGTDLYVDADLVNSNGTERCLTLFLAELCEVFEAVQKKGWDCGASPGEGLSRFASEFVHPGALDDYCTAATWLDGERADLVTTALPTDEDDNGNGCSTLFLWWLKSIGFTPQQITAGPGGTLAALYKQLTGQTTAWHDFSAACQSRWPVGTPSGVTQDNAWALAAPTPPPTPIPDPAPPPTSPPPPTDEACIQLSEDLAAGHYLLVPHEAVVAITSAGLTFASALEMIQSLIDISKAYGTPLLVALEMLGKIFSSMRKHLRTPGITPPPPPDHTTVLPHAKET